MYAYVRFQEDNFFFTCNVKNIKGLVNSKYIPGKLYKVKWTDGEYYQAKIIFMEETRQQIEEKIKFQEENNIRMKIPALNNSINLNVSSDSEFVESVQARKKQQEKDKKTLVAKSQKSLEQSIFDSKKATYLSHSTLLESKDKNAENLEMIDLKQKLEEAQNLIKLLQGNLNSTQGLSSKRKLTFSGTSQNVPSTSLNRKEIISSDDGVDLIVTDFMADNNKIVEKAIHSDLQKKSRKLSPDSESDDSMHDGDYDPTKYMRPALTQILQPQSESDDSMNDSDITRRNLINTIQTEAQVHNPRSVLHRGNPTTLEKQVSRTEEEMDGLMKDDDNEFENTSSNAPSPLLRRHPSKFVKLSKATSVNTEEIEVLQDSDDSTKGTEDNFHLFSPQPTSKSYISQSGDESMNEGAKLQGNNVSPSSQKNNNDNSNSASEIQKSSHKKNKKQVIESDDSSDDCTIPVKKQKVRKAESKEKSVKHKITKRDRKFMKDSDSEESESEKETIKKYSIVTETKKSGRKVEKVYLGKEEYIKKDTWDAINTLDDSKFVKYLAAAIWTRSVLVNRCIKNTGRLIPLPDRSPRKLLTPKKKSVVEACFNDYLDERKVHGVEKGTRLKKCGYYISQHIGSLRSQLYPEMSQNNKKHTQEPDSEEED